MSFYQDIFLGGVTCAGYSPTYSQTTPVTGVITVNIAAGSTIRKAYLFCGRLGAAPNTIVTLNGTNLTFSAANQVTPNFNTIYGGASAVHAIDVTAVVNPAVNVYNLTIPGQASTSNRYQDYYLYIAYNNATFQTVATAIFLNTQNAANIMNWGTLALTNPINTAGDAAYSFFGGYECSAGDGENVILNGTNLGTAVGGDVNSGMCGGPVGSFYYNNYVVTALSDDNVSQAISGPEVLSRFNAITTNGATSVTLSHQHAGGGSDNHPWGGFFAYRSGSVLPIEFVDFNVACHKNKAVLNWVTAMERDNETFTIERSVNAVDFEAIGTLPGAGNSTHNKYYTFTDADPGSEINYYRIRQTDKNGKTTASNPLQLQPCTGLSHYKPELYPNPVTSELNIDFRFVPQNTTYVIVNSIGEEVYKGVLDNSINRLDVSGYSAGIYTLLISDSENVFTYKFVKK